MIKKIEKKFSEIVTKLPRYNTPGTPRRILIKEEKTIVSEEEESLYRSGVGQLLYLIKHSRPDIANAVRELSKGLDGINPASIKELLRVAKFVLETPQLGLKIEPILEQIWCMVGYSDSDYATDPKTRISISGFILYFMGVPVSWRSKAQKSVTVSSSEAEFVALSECAKEIKFVYQLLQSMGIKVEIPITVHVDNIGAIFMNNNVAISQKTKHIDTRVKWFVELVIDGVLKIVFVKSEDNDSDIYTKNLGGESYNKHSNKVVWKPIDMLKQ